MENPGYIRIESHVQFLEIQVVESVGNFRENRVVSNPRHVVVVVVTVPKVTERFFSWYDGFSTFCVNGEGQIVKHVADKVRGTPR